MKSPHGKTLLIAFVASVLLTACSNQSPEQQLQSAKEFIQKNDNKSAQIQLKNALQKDPELGEARFLLGKLFLEQGDAAGAEIEFRKALAVKHTESVVVPELARTMLLLAQTQKLVDQFAGLRLNQAAADASLQTSLALAYADLGKTEEAEISLKAALAADPNHVPALMLGARQKAVAGDIDAALLAMNEILAKAPGDAEAWKLKGDLILSAKGKPEDALVAYRRSVEIKPSFVASHIAILAILMQQNKLDEAERLLSNLKKSAPNNIDFKYSEAQLAYHRKDYVLAKNLVQELLRLASKNARILQLAGAIDFQTNNLSQAEIYLTAATQGEPQNALSQWLLISTYLRSGQTVKALEAMSAITRKQDLDPRFYSLAGEVYLQNGDSKTAENYFTKAVQADPDNANARTALALAHLAAGNSPVAFTELEDISASNKGTSADMALISAHLQRKNFNKALLAVGKLEVKQPDKPIAAYLRGRIQLAQKDTLAARSSFERALGIDPSYFAAAANLAALDLADKKPNDAKQRFDRILIKNPKNGQALLASAELAALQGANEEEVAGLLSKAIEANPSSPAARLLLVELRLRNNETKLAIAAAQSGVSAIPTSLELLDALGRSQQAAAELNQAISTFTKVTNADPLRPQSHLRLAAAYLANKNAEAAEKSVRRALEIKPYYLEANRLLIITQMAESKFSEAILTAKKLQAQLPKSGIGYLLEGDINAAQKNWRVAIKAYRDGLQKENTTELAIKLRQSLDASNDDVESTRFSQKWISENPKDISFITSLADFKISKKDYLGAKENYKKALSLQPGNAAILNNLAWLELNLGGAAAIDYAEEANKIAPDQPAFLDTLASILSSKGEYQRAIDLQVKALGLQAGSTSLRLNLAKIYIAAGDMTKAKSELAYIEKSEGNTPLKEQALALLKKIP